MDLQALRTELDAGHPVTGAYDADLYIATDQINALNIVRIRTSMEGRELLDATDPTEFDSKTDAQKSQWLALCAIENLDPANGKMAASIVQNIFGGGSTTQTALVAARNETVSRATVLGLGRVAAGHVENARALP